MKKPEYKWALVAMLWGIAFFNYADRQAVFSLFPLLQKDMRLNPVELGLIGSSFAIVYGLTAPLAGWMVDRMQRRTAILGGLYLWSLICMATATATRFGQLLFFRAAEGLGETFYFPGSTSLIGDYHGPRTRSRALGFLVTSVYIGTIAGLALRRLDWRTVRLAPHLRRVWLTRHSAGTAFGPGSREAPRGAADRAEAEAPASIGAKPAHGLFRLCPPIFRTPTALFLMGRISLRDFRGNGFALLVCRSFFITDSISVLPLPAWPPPCSCSSPARQDRPWAGGWRIGFTAGTPEAVCWCRPPGFLVVPPLFSSAA